MCRTQQVIDDTTAQRILDAATDSFFRHGYCGTALRDIASAARVPVTRIYDHYPSKQALLDEIVNAGYDALLAQTLVALADAPDDAAARLEAVVWAHSDFHARRSRASAVAQTDWRSLPPEGRARVLAKRRRLHEIIFTILVEGTEDGSFTVTDPTAVSRALLTMCAAIASWYEIDAVQSPRRIARTCCELAARMTGAVPAEAAADHRGRFTELALGTAA